MNKYRIKRIKRSENFESNRLDETFVNGIIPCFPEIGESLAFRFTRLGLGTWFTSPIQEISYTVNYIILKTKNSIYHLKKGWKE